MELRKSEMSMELLEILKEKGWRRGKSADAAPVKNGATQFYHWHFELIPKLTKVAGFEWGSGFYINPTPPEEAAKFLRDAKV